VGAELTGLDLSQEIESAMFRDIEQVFHERGVICIRGQHLTPAQQVRFSALFGPVEKSRNHQYAVHPAQPEILIISNIIENGRNIGITDAGQLWHTDSSYMKVPTRCSLLHALEVPHDANGEPLGDTLFASMVQAYRDLPPAIKSQVDSLQAAHNFGLQYERRREQAVARGETREALAPEHPAATQDTLHPVIRVHPLTGDRCVYVNGAFTLRIEGIPSTDSAMLLQTLIEHSTQQRYVYRHRWKVGDLLIWDNCLTQHFAIPDYTLPARRRMHRTTVRGAA